MSKTRQYRIWKQMRTRCLNANYHEYKYYGGRGVKICERWNKFENFWEDMADSYNDTLTIDRIDSNGNYEPSNCRWATRQEQCWNKRMFKLTPNKVREIRERALSGEMGKNLAQEFGISQGVVSEIKNKGRNYAHH